VQVLVQLLVIDSVLELVSVDLAEPALHSVGLLVGENDWLQLLLNW